MRHDKRRATPYRLCSLKRALTTDLQDISLHIEYLLRHHDCVIMPGIGAFLRTKAAAVCDGEGTVRPPRLQICFNSSITSSDGLLSHSLARRNKISFEQASVMVNTVSEQCRNALANDGELAIGHLGTLSMDEERHISFHPYPPLYSDIWTERTPFSRNVRTGGRSIAAGTRTSFDPDKYYIIRISRKAVRYAAIAAVCIFTAATLLMPASRHDGFVPGQKQYASVVPGVEKLSAHKAEAATKDPVGPVKVERASEPADTAATVKEADADKYYLIVATFTKESDCEKFIASQPDAQKLRIANGGKVSRVYSASSNDRDRLIAMLNSQEHRSLHPQAWVWTRP